jgi:uncharacterized Tic20 family protein
MDDNNNSKQIEEQKRLTCYLITFFALFIIIELFVGALLIVYVESPVNPGLKDYVSALTYNYQVITDVHITDAVIMTGYGKIIVGIFGLLKLAFIGFMAAIVTSLLQTRILRKSVPPYRDP